MPKNYNFILFLLSICYTFVYKIGDFMNASNNIFDNINIQELKERVKNNSYSSNDIQNFPNDVFGELYAEKFVNVKYLIETTDCFHCKIDNKSIIELFLEELISDKIYLKELLDDIKEYDKYSFVLNSFGEFDFQAFNEDSKTYYNFDFSLVLESLIKDGIVTEDKLLNHLKTSRYSNMLFVANYLVYLYYKNDLNIEEEKEFFKDNIFGIRNIDILLLYDSCNYHIDNKDFKNMMYNCENLATKFNDTEVIKAYVANDDYFLNENQSFLLRPIYEDGSNIFDHYVEYVCKNEYEFSTFNELWGSDNKQDIYLQKKTNSNDTYFDIILDSYRKQNKLFLKSASGEYKLLDKFKKMNNNLLFYKSKYLDNDCIIEYLVRNDKEFAFELIKGIVANGGNLVDFWKVSIDGLSLLETLYNIDKDFVISLFDRVPLLKYNIELANELKTIDNTFKLENTFVLSEREAIKKYVTSKEREKIVPNNIDDAYLQEIENFRSIMLADGKSDENIVDLACDAFKVSFACNPDIALRDLSSLINIKQNDDRFSFVDIAKLNSSQKEISHFLRSENRIYIKDENSISTMIHEITHAIHYNYNGLLAPSQFQEFLNVSKEQVQNARKMIDVYNAKKDEVSNKLETNGEKINDFVEKYTDYVFKKMDLTEMQEFVKFHRVKYYQSLNDKLRQAGYDENTIIEICKNIINLEELKEVCKSQMKNYIKHVILSDLLEGEAIAQDIMDAMSNGVLFSGNFFDRFLPQSHQNKRVFAGHGSDYYLNHSIYSNNGEDARFSEIIAEYAVLKKMPNYSKQLSDIKEVFGEEFINMLDNFYNNMFVQRVDINAGNNVKK